MKFEEWTKNLDINFLEKEFKFNKNSEAFSIRKKLIENYYEKNDENSFKLREWNILFFLYGCFINYQNFIDKNSNFIFFLEEEKINWYLTLNGVEITKNDKNINNYIVNFIKFNKTMNDFLETCYEIITIFSTKKLIQEVKKISTLYNKENEKYFFLKKEEIIKYFKNQRPFFLKD